MAAAGRASGPARAAPGMTTTIMMINKSEQIAYERDKTATERLRESATNKLSLIPVMSVTIVNMT